MTTTRDDRLKGYVAFWRGQKAEVWAETKYEAQKEAARLFGARKTWEVAIELADQGGSVVHMPMM